MKKLVLASVMALASICLVSAPTLRAQDSGQSPSRTRPNSMPIKPPAHRPIRRPKPAALESFLTAYPQSVVKKAVLDELIDAYQGMADADKALSAATRLLQVDPNNMKAIYLSVFIKRGQCLKDQRSADLRRCRRACPERPHGCQERRRYRCRLDEADRRNLSDLSLRHRPRRPDLQAGLQGRHLRVPHRVDALSAAGHHQRPWTGGHPSTRRGLCQAR